MSPITYLLRHLHCPLGGCLCLYCEVGLFVGEEGVVAVDVVDGALLDVVQLVWFVFRPRQLCEEVAASRLLLHCLLFHCPHYYFRTRSLGPLGFGLLFEGIGLVVVLGLSFCLVEVREEVALFFLVVVGLFLRTMVVLGGRYFLIFRFFMLIFWLFLLILLQLFLFGLELRGVVDYFYLLLWVVAFLCFLIRY
jgi:hypothetical protein